MTTMQETNLVMNSLRVKAIDVLELLEGTITHSDKGKDSLRALNTVQILGGADHLVARATDRYRLIEGKIEGAGHLSHTLISLADTKRVIDLLKNNKPALVDFNRIGNLLTISVSGSSITVEAMEDNYPNSFGDLFSKASESVATDKATFNPAYMADYAKIAGKGKPITVTFTGDRKPMAVEVKGERVEWRGLVMPMRTI